LISLEYEGDVALITLDRPEARNALSFELLRRLEDALDEIEASSARVVTITGAGDRAFCAGADIAELQGRTALACHAGIELGQGVFNRLERLRQVSVAAINGYALGGGLELALASTFRVAARGAKLALPEVRLGLVPTYGGTQRLVRTVGRARAEEMILRGNSVDADHAYALGLVHQVVDRDVVGAAKRLAEEISSHSMATLNLARAAIASYGQGSLEDGVRAEAALGTIAYGTEDAAEGMRAFLEKRAPEFRNR
jgi:enoyl-CoA hydratase